VTQKHRPGYAKFYVKIESQHQQIHESLLDIGCAKGQNLRPWGMNYCSAEDSNSPIHGKIADQESIWELKVRY
jgi:hypothetical protein